MPTKAFTTRIAAIAGTAALTIAFLLTALASVAQAAPTVVTLGFDDGPTSQYQHRSILTEHGVKATFFINSGKVGTPGAMSWAQIADLAAEGHEIGGHTVDHVRLTTVSTAEQLHQVCDDRNTLLGHGFDIKSFAYPNGAWNTAVRDLVAGCGYASARTTGGTDYGSPCCVFAETIPPKNAMTLRAIQPDYNTGLATYQDIVNQARLFGGGWVNIVLHGVCADPCTTHGSLDIPASRLDGFLDWLETQPDVMLRTTAQVMASSTDAAPPSVALTAPEDGASVTGRVTLTADASDDKGVARVEFIVDGNVVGSDTTAPYSAAWGSATAGDTATITARAVDIAGKVAFSAARTVTVVHPDAVPPTVALTAPDAGASVEGPVTLSADASDDVAMDRVDFLVGGSVVGSDSSAPYSFDWDSSSAGATASIAARAYDAIGNAATSAARTVTVLHASPTVVTLGFDDGSTSQYTHRAILDEHGVDATFFINSGHIGGPDFMSWSQLAELTAAGHEIGGHTLDHARLTTLPVSEQVRQVCDDRQALIQHGFDVRNFAYPFGAWDATVKSTLTACGYASGRTTGGTDYPEGPVYAETFPPKNALTLRAIQTSFATQLAEYQDIVEKARYSGGGWVNIVLHDVCEDPCLDVGTYDIPASVLDGFLDWAQTRPGVTFKTTAQALGQAADTTAPTAALTAPDDGATVSRTVTLAADASDDLGVTRVEFLVDGAVVGSDTTAPYTIDWDSAPAGDTATIAARAVDPAGNAGTSAPRTVTVLHPDAVPPVVALTAPAAGASVEGPVTLSADASDDVAMDRVDFLVGGSVVGSDSSAPYSVDWDSSSAGATASIAARAYDTAGNVATSAARTVTVLHASPTVVTLGFDDGLASQYANRTVLAARGVKATYFINSNKVGTAGAMTWAQVTDLAAQGHEIAGHTLDHVRLTSVSATEQQRQVCDDRQALIQHGFDVRNFAYPHGAWNAGVKTVVANCGYSTARTTGGTDYPAGPEYAETIPPLNALTLRAIQTNFATQLAEYQDMIEKARYSGGGWVNIVLHGVCTDPCSGAGTYDIPASRLAAFLDWAQTRPDVTFKTTRAALSQPADTTAPTAAITAPAAGSTVTGTVTIAATASDNIGVTRVDFLVNGAVVGSDSTAPYSFNWNSTGSPTPSTLAVRAVDPSGNQTTSASRTVNVTQDTTNPSVSLTAPSNNSTVSGNATISANASDNVGVAKVEFLAGTTVVGTDTSAPYSVTWDSSAYAPSATLRARATDLAGNVQTSSSRTVNVSDVLAPAPTLTAPAVGATLSGTVSLQGTATDNIGVTRVDFLVNGSTVASDTSAPFSVSWNSSNADATVTVAMRARDAAGNTATTPALTVNVADVLAPTVSLTSPSNFATVSGITTIAASASDNRGVASVDFLVNGSVIGTDTSSPYSFAWNTAATSGSSTTLTARARDAAGNATTSSSRTVFIRR